MIDNCIEMNPVGGESTPRIKSAKLCRVTLTRRVQAKMRCRFDLRKYPFDHQYLEFKLKSRRVPQSGPHSATVKLASPSTFRGKNGHMLDSHVDWISEWDIVKIDGAPDGEALDFYRLQVCIIRNSTSVMTNIVLALAVILLLSFTSYGIEIDDFQDRVQVNVTLLLATMTFKFVLAEKLPAISYVCRREQRFRSLHNFCFVFLFSSSSFSIHLSLFLIIVPSHFPSLCFSYRSDT